MLYSRLISKFMIIVVVQPVLDILCVHLLTTIHILICNIFIQPSFFMYPQWYKFPSFWRP